MPLVWYAQLGFLSPVLTPFLEWDYSPTLVLELYGIE